MMSHGQIGRKSRFLIVLWQFLGKINMCRGNPNVVAQGSHTGPPLQKPVPGVIHGRDGHG
jgi:hypothetical protein